MSDVRLELADALLPLSDAAPQSARAPAVPRWRFAVALLAALVLGGALTAAIPVEAAPGRYGPETDRSSSI